MAALSKKNPRVQAARRLAHEAAARGESGLFLVEGPKLVREALSAGVRVTEVFVSPALASRPGGGPLRADLEKMRVPLLEVDDATLADLSALEVSQGIAAVAEIPHRGAVEELLAGRGDLLLVSTVQDPGNAGALVRIAAAAGMAGVIADRATADFASPKAVRASAGSILRLPSLRVADLVPIAKALASAGTSVLGATPRGGGAIGEMTLPSRVALLVGGEGRGIPELLQAACTGWVSIPMAAAVESLNVATAAAVLAFGLAERRRAGR